MFLEPHFKGQRSGWIEVVCGSMFSGKTEELIRRLRRAKFANQNVKIFKPITDNRYDENDVVSHNANSINALAIEKAEDMLVLVDNVEVIGVDEAQFFGLELTDICQILATKGIRVIVAGLDMDYRGVPFGPMPHLLAVAEYITKVHAICVHCGNLATHSYRFAKEEAVVLVGETDSYEPRCRTCYNMGNILRFNEVEKE
jgi:thymidine kinase